ncbi:MAG: ATP-binding cassette domain-containing protein [Planctomycetota bacterium]
MVVPSERAPVIDVNDLCFRYGARTALDRVTFQVGQGEIFGLLGPNGGGKTTLFRILATLYRPGSGHVRILGHDVTQHAAAVRGVIGIVFQAPSLDKKLTVRENLHHQGHLYGLRGRVLRERIDALLERLKLTDRGSDLVQTLSGGLARRVELAKGLLHRPAVLLLDEPSTGLDPGARRSLWEELDRLRKSEQTTVIVTTHIMEEADGCDRIALLDCGRLIALATPDALKDEMGGDVIAVEAASPDALKEAIQSRFGLAAAVVDGELRIERSGAPRFVAELVEAFPKQIRSVTVRKPTLEDVFVHKTGHVFATASDGRTA